MKKRGARALEVIQSWRAPEDDVSDSKHIVPTTVASEEAPLVAVTDLAKSGKQTEKKKRHQKYMHPSSQQTVAYAQKQRNALVERKHGGQELHRLSALDFAKAMREYGLFEDLTGQPCQKPECSTAKGFGAEGGSVLDWKIAATGAWNAGKEPVTLGNVYFLPELEEVTVQRILSENWLTQCSACAENQEARGAKPRTPLIAEWRGAKPRTPLTAEWRGAKPRTH